MFSKDLVILYRNADKLIIKSIYLLFIFLLEFLLLDTILNI